MSKSKEELEKEIELLKSKLKDLEGKYGSDWKRSVNKNREKYKYHSTKLLLQYENYFEDLEEQMMIFGKRSIGKCLEVLSVLRSSHFTLYRNNSEFKRKMDELLERIPKRIDENKMKIYIDEFVKNKGEVHTTIKNVEDKKVPGLHWNGLMLKYPKFKQTISELKIKIFKELTNDYMDECVRVWDSLNKKGFHPLDSLVLCGVGGKFRSRWFNDFTTKLFLYDKKFRKRFDTEFNIFKKNNRRTQYISNEEIVEKEKEIEMFKDLKKEFLTKNKEFLKKNPFNPLSTNKYSYQSPFITPDYTILPIREHNFLYQIDRVIKGLVDKLEYRKLKVEQLRSIHFKKLSKEDRKRVRRISTGGSKYFDVNDKVIFRKCGSCDKIKDVIDFYKTYPHCKSCISKQRSKEKRNNKREKFLNGVLIRLYDELGKEVKRRCNSCETLKDSKLFEYKYNRKSICVDCYVDLPNNHLTRRGEFLKGKQIRWYDNQTFKVIKKRCNRCDGVFEREHFGFVSGNIDGLNRTCKGCYKKEYELRKNKN